MEFAPWIKYEREYECEILDIPEPPCKSCKNWLPQRIYGGLDGRNIKYCGVRLCYAEDMQHDFSCYKEKEEVRDTEAGERKKVCKD